MLFYIRHTNRNQYRSGKKMKDVLELMKETARLAGAIALERRKNFAANAVHVKGTPADLVTDVDRELERFIVSRLKESFPGYGFIGEEYGAQNADSEWCFCIDPIDGTTSYVHDFPLYCVSIGLLRNNESYAGAIYVPKLDELYYAEKGKGAFLNGAPIHASACKTLGEALCATGFACIRDRRPKNNLEYFSKMVPSFQGVRRSGTAAFDMCQVAAGRIDGYWEFGLHLHDVAAGVIIAGEAGAVVSDINGGKDYTVSMVCAAPGIHQILCDELQPGLS